MPHNINFNEQTNKHSFFSVKEKAWHGLGQIVQDYLTSAEAIRFVGLDYTVEKTKLFTFDSENNCANPETEIIIPEIEVPNYFEENYKLIPVIRDINSPIIQNNYLQVKQDIEDLVHAELEHMMADPALKILLVNKH
jgi:hypothetical protein